MTHVFHASRRTGLALSLLVLVGSFPAPAHAASPADSLRLIPMPQQVKRAGGRFRIGRGARLVLVVPSSPDDRFAARDFVRDMRRAAAVRLALDTTARRASSGHGSARRILIGPLGNPRLRKALGAAGMSIPRHLDGEGYMLAVTAHAVIVAGQTNTGTFYGLQTLKQLVRGDSTAAWIPGVRIVDWPSMRWRGVSDDISRGPVPTLDYMKRQVRTMAAYKLNMYSLYMEHTFRSASHPLIGPPGGAVTPAQARALVAYAARYHVQVVPELQTFGHLHKVLRLERYDSLAEVPFGDVLTPQRPGTYKLIADRYRELAAAFPGPFFHIGEDETFELGQGQSKAEADSLGVGVVYLHHLERVRKLLLRYHRKLMFWGDIVLRHPELMDSIPKDLIAVNWSYAARDSFTNSIQPFVAAGLTQIVAPGVQDWNQIFPNEDAAVVNIPNFVRDGQRAKGVIGMLNTEWDDDGETLFQMSWYGVLLGAAASWQPAPMDTLAFDSAFDWAFFRARGHALDTAIRELGSVTALLSVGNTDPFFWRDPFRQRYQMRARQLVATDTARLMRLRVEDAEARVIRARGRVRRNADVLDDLRFAARRYDHMGLELELMVQLGKDYWNAYLHLSDPSQAGRLGNYCGLIYNRLREMAEDLSSLRGEYRAIWLSENRPYWLHSVLARYDLAISQWLQQSQRLRQILRTYRATGTLPDPRVLGLGPEPAAATSP